MIKKFINNNPFVVGGAAVGLGLSAYINSINVASGVVQLATYPLYMGYCAVAPVLRIASPLWVTPALTSLSTALGVVGQMAVDADAKSSHIYIHRDEDEVEAA